jgi:hypothetical protein
LCHVLKLQPRRAKHHAKRDRRCRSANSGRLMTLLDYHYTVVSWLVRKHTQTKNVKDLPRSGRPRVTSDRDASGRRLHEAETGSRLTNGFCVMSLNCNHVVLNTMPNVIVDVGLPTVDTSVSTIILSGRTYSSQNVRQIWESTLS